MQHIVNQILEENKKHLQNLTDEKIIGGFAVTTNPAFPNTLTITLIPLDKYAGERVATERM